MRDFRGKRPTASAASPTNQLEIAPAEDSREVAEGGTEKSRGSELRHDPTEDLCLVRIPMPA